MAQLQGEGLKAGFDSSLRLEFHGSKVTSDAGFIPYRDLDEIIMQAVRLESGEAWSICLGLQSGQLSQAIGTPT